MMMPQAVEGVAEYCEGAGHFPGKAGKVREDTWERSSPHRLCLVGCLEAKIQFCIATDVRFGSGMKAFYVPAQQDSDRRWK
jgi:hypothetical protein